MSRNLLEQFARLPETLGGHLVITVIPLALGIAISLPLGVVLARRRSLRSTVLALVGVIQTVPSLALLALMVPVLAALGALTERTISLQLPALGLPPTLIALTLYSMLPMVRNTVTGLAGVDPDLTEAARALGMSPGQRLRRVELPLAAPVIIAGIRTATVWVVGIATLATPVGQVCLGNYIFMGLQTRNWTAVLFGCIAAAGLAILLDGLIGILERASRDRSRWRAVATGLALVVLLAAGLAAPALFRKARPPDRPASARTLVIGAKTFTEQYILAAVVRQALEAAGFPTDEKAGLGSTVIFDALASGQIDVYVDYSGTIWTNHMHRPAGLDSRDLLDQMSGWLETRHRIQCLGALGFENAYALAMRREAAGRLGIAGLPDLAAHAPSLAIGGDYEFFGRPEWQSLRETYGLSFARQVSYDSTFMYEAVARGDVDVISAFSSDGRIQALDLVVLDDPRHAIPPYDAVVLLSARAGGTPGVVAALEPLIGAIDVDSMRHANEMVDRSENKKTVGEAAAWLESRIEARHPSKSGGRPGSFLRKPAGT